MMARAAKVSGPFLYLPIEVSARELDAKLLIAHFAVARGIETIIGQKWLMQRNIDHMPPGIMLFKTLTILDAKIMRNARERGYHIAAIDEEVPGLITRNEGLRWVSTAALDQCDQIYTVGAEHQETMLQRFPEHGGKCEVAGNPRWDLLRPEFAESHAEDVAGIRAEFGPYILINTNLGFTNSGKGTTEQMVRKLERGGKFDRRKPADAAFLAEHLRLEEASWTGINDLLRRLPEAFPGRKIILRPHPSENAETWLRAIRGLKSVDLVRRGSAVPWILGSDALVHAYCTTGVEAFALGKPAICFQPVGSPVLANYLSPRVNFPAETVDAVVAKLVEVFAATQERFAYPDEFHRMYDRSFAAQTGPFAAERIAESLVRRFGLASDHSGDCAAWQRRRGYTRRIRTKAHNVRLMPEITAAEISGRLARFDRALGTTWPVNVEPCGDRTFHLHGHVASRAATDTGREPLRLPRWLKRLAAGA